MPKKTLDQVADEINQAYGVACKWVIEGVCAIGQRLNDAKKSCDKGDWAKLLTTKLRFSQHKAQRFMRIAAKPALADAKSAPHLPSDYTVLADLALLDNRVIVDAISSKAIHPEMNRSEVRRLRNDALDTGRPEDGPTDDNILPPAAEPEPDPVYDELEVLIEDPDVARIFQDKTLKDAADLVGQVIKKIRESDEDGVGAFVSRQSLLSRLNEIKKDIRHDMPHSLCPCNGMSNSCKRCQPVGRRKSFGWLSKLRYKQLPAEDKQ